MEGSVDILRQQIGEVVETQEVRRREWEEQRARWEREEDQRRIADSIKESREQLAQVIQSWAAVISLEQFLKGVEERALTLPEEQRPVVLRRLELARAFIGTPNPMNSSSPGRHLMNDIFHSPIVASPKIRPGRTPRRSH